MFAVSGIGLFIVLNIIAAKINPAILPGGDILPFGSPDVEAVSVGSSVNRALDFRSLGIDGREAWLSSSDIYEASFLLQRGDFRGLRLVMLGIADLDWPISNATAAPDVRRRYYQTVGPALGWQPISGDWRNLIISRYLPIRRPDAWSGVVRAALEKLGILDPMADQGDLPATALDASARWLAAAIRARLRSAPPDSQRQRGLDELAELSAWSREREITLVVYQPPFWRLVSELIESDPALRSYLRRQQEALSRLPGIIYYREDDSAISRQPDLFRDAAHLNSRGARVFSSGLRRHLQKLGVLEDVSPASDPPASLERSSL